MLIRMSLSVLKLPDCSWLKLSMSTHGLINRYYIETCPIEYNTSALIYYGTLSELQTPSALQTLSALQTPSTLQTLQPVTSSGPISPSSLFTPKLL